MQMEVNSVHIEALGIVFGYGDFVSGFWFSAAVLAATTAVFYAASLAAIKARRG
jgi:hypothetical protein